ncbi:MAG TPA: hypothetical protein VMV79_08065, partial [Alphaproteobacteria bacterium]|nr:hypothetical protein [Alphaproteobacteria bacterium]
DQFEFAASYKEAVEKILGNSGSFDGIISDYQYSGANDDGFPNEAGFGGRDLQKFLHEEGGKIPLVYLSGTSPDMIRQELRALNIDFPYDHIFMKSWTVQDLINAVDFLKKTYREEPRPTGVPPVSETCKLDC